ncbi:MAG TPA: hypothetical protein VG651_15850 [Stellaceae bacterium]|nr:hypothetical protein [Stellaceae bacterium]
MCNRCATPGRWRRPIIKHVAGFLAAVCGTVACSTAAPAQTASCSGSGDTCTIDAGSSSYTSAFQVPSNYTTVDNNGTFSVTNMPSGFGDLAPYALQAQGSGAGLTLNNFAPVTLSVPSNSLFYPTTFGAAYAFAVGGGGSSTAAGSASGPITADINAPVSLSYTSPYSAPGAYGVYATTSGGNGGGSSDSDHNATSGGGAGDVTVTVSATNVTTTTNGNVPAGAIIASQYGGTGGSAAAQDNSLGGAGGGTGTLTVDIENSTVTASRSASGPDGVSGVLAFQFGGTGGTGGNNVAGGAGGAAGALNLTVNNASISGNGSQGDGVLAQQTGGAGGTASTGESGAPATGGQGGTTGLLTANITNSSISSSAARGLALVQTGGAGGSGDIADYDNFSYGYTGGDAGGISATFTGGTTGNVITGQGDNVPTVLIESAGGAGGTGATTGGGLLQYSIGGGDGGNGGNAGAIKVTSSGTLTITATGNMSSGLAIIGQGGLGGTAGHTTCSTDCYPAAGGNGGSGSSVEVDLDAGASITTAGASAPAVAALSFGANGGPAGGAQNNYGSITGAASGDGGASGLVTVYFQNGVALATTGAQSPGLLVQSIGGMGGSSCCDDAGNTGGGIGNGTGTSGGDGGAAAGANVTSTARITTAGTLSPGILVQVLSGPGGAGGYGDGLSSTGGAGAAGGASGTASVANYGPITTSGDASQGVLVQSIGGGGGNGGTASGFFTSTGGTAAATAADGGSVDITTQNGNVTTGGAVAAAILGQSIGGGGGNGGSTQGVFYNQGGTAGVGGDGGPVTVHADGTVSTDGTPNPGTLTTSGTLSHGVLAQSIGGSGGTGGNVNASGTVVSYAVGGSGGAGGAGGTVDVIANGATIYTHGSGANGIVAQSIGGGGGAGGAAYAFTAGSTFAIAAAIGGAGGDGGSSGAVTVTTSTTPTTINTGRPTSPVPALPVDAIGILAQSISGGGGVGGGASAEAVAIGLPGAPDTAETPAVTVAGSVGGTGGSGGTVNGAVQVALNPGTSITTAGAGSIGVLAQSIGGGGGQGGDSSTLTATIGSANKYLTAADGSLGIQVDLAVGAQGGSGGAGAGVTVNLDNTATIATTGDYADGIVAQSIGGGGGNAGAGSSSVYTTGKQSSYKVKLDLGAQGGGGGNGDTVTVNLAAGSSITTSGSGAAGVLAQSIGGGGGNSTGYTFSLDGLPTPASNTTLSPTLNVGATGGYASNGGSVTVTSQGSIVTTGDDAPGIVLQSIGGGGGVGGSAGADAAPGGDKTETPSNALAVAQDEGGLNTGSVTLNVTPTLNIGGAGGAAGNGGAVTLTQEGSVQTSGDYSPGIVLQSIGGSGGRGGTAVTGTQNNSLGNVLASLTLNTTIAVGGSGSNGNGGNGGNVVLSLGGATISTGAAAPGSTGTGFQSFGVLAQSIGGGGGIAGDGTAGPKGSVTLGSKTANADFAGNNDGGSVTINVPNGGSASTIRTTGDYATGVVAQSIGGGGGVYGGGSAAPVTDPLGTGSNVTLKLGSSATSSFPLATQPGDGGSVLFDYPGLNIGTTGNGAFGVLAQSIGGGGGVAAVGGPATVAQLGASTIDTTTIGNGGSVTVNLGSNGSITTTGIAAHGVVAQSIGGGGGVALLASTGTLPSLTTTAPSTWRNNYPSGTGGTVSVETHGPITVTGNGAFAILAQSISGGGGLATSGAGTVFAGSTSPGSTAVAAGAVTVTTQGAIQATGQNGVGIFAQSASGSPSVASGTVTVKIQDGESGSTVTGGAGAQGYGVWVDGGNSDNTLEIDAGSTLSALSGNAVNYTGSYGVNPTNNGQVAGTSFNLGNGTFTNAGSLIVGGAGTAGPYYGAATLRGNLVQTASGQLVTNVDFASGRAGYLVVTGNAALDGRVVPQVSTVLPNVNVPIMIVDGTVTGTLQGSRSTLYAYDVQDPPSTLTLSARSLGFAPAGFGVNGAAAELAAYLQPAFNTAATPELGTFFATLGNLADAGAGGYVNALQQLSPGSVLAFASRARAETTAFGDALLHCDRFIGTSVVTTETGCGWAEVSGGVADQSADGGYAGFADSTLNYRLGGQTLIAPGWTLGGALGYTHSWLDGDFTTTGRGDAGYAGLSITREWQGWRFSGGLLGSFSSNSTSRSISIPGYQATLNGKPDVDTQAALLRADYTVDAGGFAGGTAYMRPSMTVDIVRVHAGAFSEGGQKIVGLDFGDSDTVSGVFAPQMEFGLRTDLQDGMALRSYVTLGASLPTASRFRQPVRLQGASLAAGSFEATLPTDGAAGTLGVGAQLFTSGNLDLRVAYTGTFSGRVTDNAGMLVGTLHF